MTSSTSVQPIDVIGAVESAVPVGEATFGDFEIWPVIRMMIALALKPDSTGFERGRLERVRRVVQPGARRRRRRITSPGAVVLTQRSNRMVPRDGRFFDVLADPIAAQAAAGGLAPCVWSWADTVDARPPWRQDVDNIDIELAFAAARALARARLGRVPEQLRTDVHDLLAATRSAGVDLVADDAIARVLTVDGIARAVSRRIDDNPPELAFVVCWYGLPGLGFVLGCRRLGIRTVDIQHGVQGPGHEAYGAWAGDPGARSRLIPDRFWCWRPTDAAWIDAAMGPGRAVVGGHPLHDVLDRDELDRLAQSASTTASKPRAEREVLVTLQPGVDIADVVLQAIEMAPRGWRWWVRAHPTTAGEEAKPYRDLAADVEVEAASALPLITLLERVDAHVTAYSSVVVEAASAGVPSIGLSPLGERLYPTEVASGALEFASGAADLTAAIARSVPRGAKEERPDPNAALAQLRV